jgi:uncharacterized iron-regulated protein
MRVKALRFFLPGLALILQAACMTDVLHRHPNLQDLPGGIKVGDIIETSSAEIISFETLMAELAHVRVIYVGETHPSAEDHRVQLQVMKGLYARNPALILALEMFPREAQPLLDQYSKGSITEEEFLQEVKWEQVWGYPFPLYRSLLSWARDHHIKIVGLNAPREIVSKIAQSGLAGLDGAERNRVAREFHRDDPKHQAYIRQQYHQHLKGKITDFDTFLEAQLAWEETMAETLAQTLASSTPEEQIVVVIGKGHISDHVGVPKLTHDRVNDAYRTIAPLPLDYPGRTADPSIADFVWITDRSEPVRRARLGALFRVLPSEGGLKILEILPNSAAAKAGLKEGDILKMVDGNPVNTLEDIHRAFSTKKVHNLALKRDGQEISVTVTLSP